MCSLSVLGLRNNVFFSENHQRLDFLNMLDKLGVKEGETGELVLVEVHHEQLVSGRQVHPLAGELPVKVGHVFAMSLQKKRTFRFFRSC